MTRTTTRTDEEILADALAKVDALDPAAIATADRAEDLRAIRAIIDEIADADERLTRAVADARANGRSWGHIAIVLGVTRQSAHAKYHRAVEQPREGKILGGRRK